MVLCGVCYGPLRSLVVLCGPLRYLVRPVPENWYRLKNRYRHSSMSYPMVITLPIEPRQYQQIPKDVQTYPWPEQRSLDWISTCQQLYCDYSSHNDRPWPPSHIKLCRTSHWKVRATTVDTVVVSNYWWSIHQIYQSNNKRCGVDTVAKSHIAAIEFS